MRWLFAPVFAYRDRRYYFCNGEGQAFALNPGEADAIALRLTVVLAMVVPGFVGWAGYSLYLTARPLMGSAAAAPAWLVDPSIIYPAVIAYWAIAWLLSCATWAGLSSRFAEREPAPGICSKRRSQLLRSTKPMTAFALGLFGCAFVAQGFGDVCFLFRGTGYCEIITITPA